MTTRSKSIKSENDLQTYLETFNKDLEGNTAGPSNVQVEDDDDGEYFMDQSGNYYFQASKDSEPILTEPPDGNVHYVIEEEDQTETITTRSRKQKLVLPKQNDDFDNVSVVQSSNANGEVSYVFIMDEKNDANNTETVATEEVEEIVATNDDDNDDGNHCLFFFIIL